MEGFFTGVGALAITTKTMFWVCALLYIAFGAWSAYVAFSTEPYSFPLINSQCNDLAKTLHSTTIWTLTTNCVGLFGGAAFYNGEKGETCSVIGGLMYSFNFISMVVLFIYTQIKVFSTDMKDCSALITDTEGNRFIMEKQVLTFYVYG